MEDPETATSVHTDPKRAAAAESVEALLGDLRHVVGRMPHEEWPAMSQTVLDHHHPAIEESLLGPDHVGLQTACHGALEALRDDDYARAKASIDLIRKYEVRLGLELEDLRTSDPA